MRRAPPRPRRRDLRETSLVFPLIDHFAPKTSLVDLYEATPAEGAESNTLQTLVGVSVLF